jgi:hypothetical protein
MVRDILLKIVKIFTGGFLIVSLSCLWSCKSTFIPEYNDGRKLTISYGDSAVVFSVNRKFDSSTKNLKRGRSYYYYNLQGIHVTKGALIGKPLDKQFVKQDRNGQLIESGTFKNGLKHGEWKRWYDNGEIACIEKWKKGCGIGTKVVYDGQNEVLGEYRWKDNSWCLSRKFERHLKRNIKIEEKRLNRELVKKQKEELSANKKSVSLDDTTKKGGRVFGKRIKNWWGGSKNASTGDPKVANKDLKTKPKDKPKNVKVKKNIDDGKKQWFRFLRKDRTRKYEE